MSMKRINPIVHNEVNIFKAKLVNVEMFVTKYIFEECFVSLSEISKV
jgi:hypothetical protein